MNLKPLSQPPISSEDLSEYVINLWVDNFYNQLDHRPAWSVIDDMEDNVERVSEAGGGWNAAEWPFFDPAFRSDKLNGVRSRRTSRRDRLSSSSSSSSLKLLTSMSKFDKKGCCSRSPPASRRWLRHDVQQSSTSTSTKESAMEDLSSSVSSMLSQREWPLPFAGIRSGRLERKFILFRE